MEGRTILVYLHQLCLNEGVNSLVLNRAMKFDLIYIIFPCCVVHTISKFKPKPIQSPFVSYNSRPSPDPLATKPMAHGPTQLLTNTAMQYSSLYVSQQLISRLSATAFTLRKDFGYKLSRRSKVFEESSQIIQLTS